jgi:hypothetical protein
MAEVKALSAVTNANHDDTYGRQRTVFFMEACS